MNKSIIYFFALFALLVSNSAYATNWVMVMRFSDPKNSFVQYHGSPVTEYIDIDSVVKDGNSLTLWRKEEFDKPDYGTKATLMKFEVNLSDQQYRMVENHFYDSNYHEIRVDTKTYQWSSYKDGRGGKEMNKSIEIALQYAKEGKGNEMKPAP